MAMSPAALDTAFQQAVTAMDAGDLAGLERLVVEYPDLLSERLDEPGPWLRDQIGTALNGFFARPFLLWFVAEDPVRNGRLPANITEITRMLVARAHHANVPSYQEQLDTTLRLVAWSGIAAREGVQIALIDVLVDAGAAPAANAHNALVNRHRNAASHLLRRGGEVTVATVACLGPVSDGSALLARATPEEIQFALVLAALNGQAEGVAWLLRHGARPNAPCPDLYPHGTPLHHAVSGGSLEAVRELVLGGADVTAVDSAWKGTPLGWAYYAADSAPERRHEYDPIIEYLTSVSPSAG